MVRDRLPAGEVLRAAVSTGSDHEAPLTAKSVRAALCSLDWDFGDAARAEGIHAIHPYPAKFIAEIPRALIETLSKKGDRVLDPFCGGGTTGVEAIALGRSFIGIDANAFAVLLTKVKLGSLSDRAVGLLTSLNDEIDRYGIPANTGAWRPVIANIDKWYDPLAVADLASLRAKIISLSDNAARNVALLAFVCTAARVSNQESETRYVSEPRAYQIDTVRISYLKDLERILRSVLRITRSREFDVRECDARLRSSYARIPTGSVSAIITSPPYPNAYDYHLYHRFRLFWLGDGPNSLRKVEIGSHLKNQGSSTPASDYLRDMRQVFANAHRVLSPLGYFALVVGDGLHKGIAFKTAEELGKMASEVGFSIVVCLNRKLPDTRRSVTKAGRRLTEEQILVLQREEGPP